MYVAVKGGEEAIATAHRLLAEDRRGDPAVPALTLEQITGQLTLAVDRVMCEGSCYDPGLAALAIKQARGDLLEAIFLLRAYRTTLPRLGLSGPIDTAAMTLRRRISATFKDLPGGQVLGSTFDYTHRLLDFELAATHARAVKVPVEPGRGGCRRGAVAEWRGRRAGAPGDRAAGPRRTHRARAAGCRAARGGRRDARATGVSRRPRRPAAAPGPRRRGIPPGARLLHAARIRPQSALRGRDPSGRGGGRAGPRRARLSHHHRRDHRDRMSDGEPVQGLGSRAAPVHPRLWPGLRQRRAQGDGHGAGGSRPAGPRAGGGRRVTVARTGGGA